MPQKVIKYNNNMNGKKVEQALNQFKITIPNVMKEKWEYKREEFTIPAAKKVHSANS